MNRPTTFFALAGEYFKDLYPNDDSVYARLAAGTQTGINKAVQSAVPAFPEYTKRVASECEAILLRAAGLLEQCRDVFLEVLIDEVGSPIGKA